MGLTNSIVLLMEQGMEELTTLEISFGLKLLVIFGVIYLFNTVLKTGGSAINLLIYVAAFFKWIILKIMRKDV